MLGFLKKLFGFSSAEPVAEAPYKVETAPVAQEPAKCGCGRSPTGFCVGLHKLTPEEWATHADNPAKAAVVEVVKKPAKPKAPPKPKTPAKPKAPPKPKKAAK